MVAGERRATDTRAREPRAFEDRGLKPTKAAGVNRAGGGGMSVRRGGFRCRKDISRRNEPWPTMREGLRFSSRRPRGRPRRRRGAETAGEETHLECLRRTPWRPSFRFRWLLEACEVGEAGVKKSQTKDNRSSTMTISHTSSCSREISRAAARRRRRRSRVSGCVDRRGILGRDPRGAHLPRARVAVLRAARMAVVGDGTCMLEKRSRNRRHDFLLLPAITARTEIRSCFRLKTHTRIGGRRGASDLPALSPSRSRDVPPPLQRRNFRGLRLARSTRAPHFFSHDATDQSC